MKVQKLYTVLAWILIAIALVSLFTGGGGIAYATSLIMATVYGCAASIIQTIENKK